MKKRIIRSKTNIPEESNIRTILLLESRPNPAGAYPGVWMIMSFDGNDQPVEDHEGKGVGNAQFEYHEKKEAFEWLRALEERTGVKSNHLKNKTPATSMQGLINTFRKN